MHAWFNMLSFFPVKLNGRQRKKSAPQGNFSTHGGPVPRARWKILTPGFYMGFRTGRNGDENKLEVRLDRFISQPKTGFPERRIAFSQVARLARNDRIVPVCSASPGFGLDMIHGKWMTRYTTILAGVIVPSQNIFFAECHTLSPIPLDHFQDPDHRGKLKGDGG